MIRKAIGLFALLLLVLFCYCGDTGPQSATRKNGIEVLWGNNQIINKGDYLGFNSAVNPAIRVYDSEGNPVDGKWVKVEKASGPGDLIINRVYTRTLMLDKDTWTGVAQLDIKHIIDLENLWGEENYLLRIFREDYLDTCFLDFRVIYDPESTFLDPYTHQKTNGPDTFEVCGDGFDNCVVDPLDSNAGLKDLYIELDYASMFGAYIDETCELIKDIYFNTAHIDMHFILDDVFAGVGGINSNYDAMDILSNYRNASYRYALHVVIIDGSFSNHYGRAIQYRGDAGVGEDAWECRRLTDSLNAFRYDYLDRCGVIAAGKQAIEAVYNATNYGPDKWPDSAHVLAILCAHEIGHALGINLHSDTSNMGIMLQPDFKNKKLVYSDFDYFIGWEFDSNSTQQYPYITRSGLNVRDILGVHNIDIGN